MDKSLARATSFWHPIYRRRFNSAMLVLLAHHLFPRLSATQQTRVDDELTEIFKRQSEFPYRLFAQKSGELTDGSAALRGVAMARLDLPTEVDGLAWSDFVLPSWKRVPSFAYLAFRRLHRATDDAVDYLHAKGLDLDEGSTHSRRWMESMRARYP